MAESFIAELLPVPHGGHYVIVPKAVAAGAGLRHGQRVRGTVNGVRYRSSLMKYSGMFHLGMHKATLAEAGVAPVDAKKSETRRNRLDKIVATLAASADARE